MKMVGESADRGKQCEDVLTNASLEPSLCWFSELDGVNRLELFMWIAPE